MAIPVKGEFRKRDMHAPVQTHCRLDGGPCARQAVRVVLIRHAVDQRWFGLVSDTPVQDGVPVANAARDYMDAACRLLANPISLAAVTWLHRHPLGSLERMTCSSDGVKIAALHMPGTRPHSYDALIAAIRQEGIEPDDTRVSEAIQWALTD